METFLKDIISHSSPKFMHKFAPEPTSIKLSQISLCDNFEWICYKKDGEYYASLFIKQTEKYYFMKEFSGENEQELKHKVREFANLHNDIGPSHGYCLKRFMGKFNEECYFSFDYPLNQ